MASAAARSETPAPPDYLGTWTRSVDRALDGYLPAASAKPSTLHRAMRYSVFAGGKRMRPALCIAAAEACGGAVGPALPAACAVECVHTYSLVHDDLPCMDDDDFRRGRPTSHKVFGEAVAVLAGDALLAEAFRILAGARATPRHTVGAMVAELAAAAGSRMLVAGQVADLEAEGGDQPTRAQLRFIHERKTSALVVASLRLGAMSADAPPGQIDALSAFGRNLGLAFQVVDDILDVTATSESLGKTAGKDEAAGKATYPSLIGLDASRREAQRLTRAAHAALAPFGKRAARLAEIADRLLDRGS